MNWIRAKLNSTGLEPTSMFLLIAIACFVAAGPLAHVHVALGIWSLFCGPVWMIGAYLVRHSLNWDKPE